MTKILFILAILTLITHILSLTTAFSAFDDDSWGVRPMGMGGAFTAVADDANAPLYNPAGISQIGKPEATFSSAKLFTGLDGVDIGQNYFSCVYPVSPRTGNVGLTWSSIYTPQVYREDTIALSYGKRVIQNISVGANVKYLRHEYTLDERTAVDPVFINGGTSKGNFSLDAGAMASWPDAGVSVALVSRNMNQPDVGLASVDKVSNENVLGLAYSKDKLDWMSLEHFTFAVDVARTDSVTEFRAGVESWFFDDKFAARLGFQPQALTMGLGYQVGLWPGTNLLVDYAFAWPLNIENSTGNHKLAVTFRFPG